MVKYIPKLGKCLKNREFLRNQLPVWKLLSDNVINSEINWYRKVKMNCWNSSTLKCQY